ncbi:MAG: trigger factor [Candidatus Aminicenantes bacterium]|nr:trigger factor [Candidatus Aminicenantes bacterium]
MEQTKHKLSQLSPTRRKMEIEISPEKVQEEYNRILERYRRQVKLKGFRKGMAPRELVESVYREDIEHSVTNSLVPDVLEKILRQENLNPADTPVVKEIKFKAGQPLTFVAEFDVWPEFKLPDYHQIKITKKKPRVTQKDIEVTLKQLQQRSIQYLPVENRGVKEGDYVIIELQGRDLKTKRFLPKEKVAILAGHQENEPQLNQVILGKKVGETATFTVSYPADSPYRRLAGKNIEYHLKIEGIKEKKVPEINNEFARELGDFQNLADLKKKIKEELSEAKQEEARRATEEELVKKILEKTQLEVPQSVLEKEQVALLRRWLSERPQQPINQEEYEKLQKKAREEAEQSLRKQLLLTRIAREEKIELTEEELNEELRKIGQKNNLTPSQVQQILENQGRWEEMKHSLLLRKTIDFLMDSVIIE